MKTKRADRRETFAPLKDKTLFSMLRQLFVDEFGYGNKIIFAEAMIERILTTIDAFVVPHSMLKPGQMLWMAVAYDGRKHAMRPMREIPQVPVVLDLVSEQDLDELAADIPFPTVRQHRHARLLKQSLEQGGVLAQSDLAAVSLRHHSTIHSDIVAASQEEGHTLPYRGSLQDLGATTSHKADVARLLEEGYLEPEICRLLHPTHHLSAVENYAQTYKNTTKLLERGFAPQEISSILGLGLRTITTYVEIVIAYHPEIVAMNANLQL